MNIIPLSDTPHFRLSIHLLMDTWVASTFFLSTVNNADKTGVHKYLWDSLLSILSDMYPEVELLGHGLLLLLLFSRSVLSDSWRHHGLQHARLHCPSPSPRACSNSTPSSRWCHPTILSSAIPFSSCPQFLPASGSFPMSRFFASGAKVLEFQLQSFQRIVRMISFRMDWLDLLTV